MRLGSALCGSLLCSGIIVLALSDGDSFDTPTYSNDVAPIIIEHCVQCHRPGEVAPFSLLTYEDVKKRAGLIADVIRKRIMPPWKAVHGYNEFIGENRLTDEKIETLARWAGAGAPRGDVAKEPKPPEFDSEWALGEPDLIVSPEKPYVIGAEGRDDYRNFVIKTNFTDTKYVVAIDVKPGNKRVVHHVIAFLDESGRSSELEAKQNDGQPGYSTFGGVGFLPSGSLGGWAPGLRPVGAPPGVAFELKPKARIVLQVHYRKSGKEETDQTRVGLYFSKVPVKQIMRLAWLANPTLRIPAGAANHKVDFTLQVPTDITAYAAMPHMHLLGKSMKAWVELPDGKTKPIVWVDDWDFHWQFIYAFKEPLKVPRGSKIRIEAFYDNSENNPNNPNNPPKSVTWGEQTSDEMFLLVVPFTIDGERVGAGLQPPPRGG